MLCKTPHTCTYIVSAGSVETLERKAISQNTENEQAFSLITDPLDPSLTCWLRMQWALKR